MSTELEYLFVLFPPGAGGNHLANIISCSPRFQKRFDIPKYNSLTKDAHVSKISNLDIDDAFIDSIIGTSTVLCGHVFEYLWIQDKINRCLSPRKFISITIDESINEIALNRMQKLGVLYSQPYSYHGMLSLYSQKYLERLLLEKDFFQISINDIFTEQSTRLVQQLETQLFLDLDTDLVEQLHQKWFTMITSLE